METVAPARMAPVGSTTVPVIVPEFDCAAHRPGILNEKQIAITAQMTRLIDVYIDYPLKSFDLVFDYVLGENKVNRRGPGEERERGNILGRSRGLRNMNRCEYLGDVDGYICGYRLNYDMSRYAKRAISMSLVTLAMRVTDGQSAAKDD
jgi:hypothetical protein